MTAIDYYSQPDGLRLGAELGLTEKQERKLRNFTWERVVVGNDLDTYLDWAGDEFPKRKKKVLTQAFDTAFQARRAQVASWPADARSTPLMTAFAELADLGIVARGNFSCCGNCASGEIWEERDDSRTWRGYMYFHSQDADRIPDDRTTYVGYGVFLDAYLPESEWDALSDQAKDETYARLVRELMAEATVVLERHGVEVEWDGSLGVRILLKNVDWYVEV